MNNVIGFLSFTSSFMPHGYCLFWLKELLLLHVISDSLIALAYYSIPIAIIYFIHKRPPSVYYRRIFQMFALFIIACGATHALEVWTIWHPAYWLSGVMKAITAAISITAAVMLWVIMPTVLTVPSPRRLRRVTKQLNLETKKRQRMLAALQESDERFRSAFDYAAIGMGLVSLDGCWLKVNKALCHIIGYSETDLLTMRLQSITHRDDWDKDQILFKELLAGRYPSIQMEQRYVHKNGRSVWVLLAISLVRDIEGSPVYFVAQIKNITARKKSEQAVRQVQQELEIRVAARTRELAEANTELAEANTELAEANTKLAESNRKLERLTRIDDLTGLYNRRYLMESLNHTLRTACRYKLPICLLMLDLDHFKRINDTYGHLIGDRVLVTVGRLLKENLRNGSDMAGRFGGEEFCVVLPHTGLDGAMAAAEKLRLTIAKAAILNNEGKTFTVTCSIGLVEGLPSKISGTELLRRADKALYHAKECGRNQIRVA